MSETIDRMWVDGERERERERMDGAEWEVKS